MDRDLPIIVVGAGVAGLAAARHLRAHHVPVTLIEAAPRIGGRAWTTLIGPDPFDHGATWLHDADRNPLVPLATPEDQLTASDGRAERLSIDGRPATPADHAAYDEADRRLDQVAAAALAGPDTTLAAAMAPMAHDPWSKLIALWEGPIIAAADADRLGLLDWHRNRLQGRNMVPAQGVGAFLARRLATQATLGTPATRIGWSGPGVHVETPRGVIHARAAIVTASTGVLASGAIRFDPPLPPDIEAAFHALPMGLLSKVAFHAAGPDRLGLDPGTLVVDREGRMTFNAWPQGRAHLVGFMGGSTAWSVAHDPHAAEHLARTELARALGHDALRSLGPAPVVTTWGTDPLTRGAYAYAGPGDAPRRATLAAAFPAERLLFAGEALRTDGLAGTVGGAYLSGIEAAERLIKALSPRETAG